MNFGLNHWKVVMNTTTTRGKRIATRALVAGASIALVASPLSAANAAEAEWSYSVETLSTNVNNGYQLALDADNRRVYFSDAKWTTSTEVGTGKLSVFSSKTNGKIGEQSFLNLTRADGSAKESELPASGNSMRTSFSPYGVAVDGKTTSATGAVDPTIITITARSRNTDDGVNYGYGGNVVVYSHSQGAPTDADRVWKFEDGTPVFDGPRRVAVNTKTHKAYVTNLGTSRGSDPADRPGYVAVIDLTTKKVDARIAIPENSGAIGVTVDEDTNTVYVGGYLGGLYAINGAAVNTADPKNVNLNAGAVTTVLARGENTGANADGVGHNARPTFNAELKRLYISEYNNQVIKVVDADKSSSNYGKLIHTIENAGSTNAVEIDGKRGLLYSANLGDQNVAVYNTTNHQKVLTVPTSGNALNIGIDPVTRDAWVSNFAAAGKTDIISVTSDTDNATLTNVVVPNTTYGKIAKATVTVNDVYGDPVSSGTVTVQVAGSTQTKPVRNGEVRFNLAKNLSSNTRTVKATYNGSATLEESEASTKYTIAKGTVNRVAYKLTKRPTTKKAGTARITVTKPSGLANATGKVTVTLTKGTSSKKVTGTLRGNKVSVKLPKLAKGTWKVKVKYAGNGNYKAKNSKTYNLKVTK